MKRTLFYVIALFSAVQFANAQAYNNKSGFGIKGGANFSDVYTQRNTPYTFERDSEMKIGFHAGIFAEAFLNDRKNMSIQTELFYSEDGYTINNFTLDSKTGELDYTMKTYNIPVLFKYYFCENFNAFFGPQAVYQESSNYTLDGEDVTIDNRRIESVNLNVVGGIEFTTNFGLSINARYIHGTRTMYKQLDDIDVVLKSFQVGAGFKF